MGGSFTAEFLVDTERATGWYDPELLLGVERLEEVLERDYGFSRVLSPVSLIREMKRLIVSEGAESAGRPVALPRTRNEAAQLFLLLEGSDALASYVSTDYQVGRVSALLGANDYTKLGRRLPEMEDRVNKILRGAARVSVTGFLPLMAKTEVYLMDTLVRSLGLSFTLVFVLMAVFFRSLRLGILALGLNLPVLLTLLGVMGWVGVSIDSVSVVVGSLLLGLIVDDTIHFFSRCGDFLRNRADPESAVRLAILTSGRAMIFTSLLLGVGFLASVLGSLKPNVAFSLLGALAVALAVAVDLIVLPALLRLLQRVRPAWRLLGA